MYPKIARNIFYPLLDLKRGSKTLKYLKELNRSQWFKLEQLIDLQNKKLKLLLIHAYNNVPYYHKIFRNLNLKSEDIKQENDLLKVPILTKEIIRKNYSELIAKNIPQEGYFASSTGGSTGQPLQFIQNKKASNFLRAVVYRSWQWTGWSLGDRYVNLWGASKDLARAKRFKTKLRQALLKDNLLLSSYDMTEQKLNEYIDKIRQFKPKFIRGYASAIYLLAEFMKHNNIEDLQPDAIITTAENLFDYQRELIEKQFDCKVFDCYGTRENIVIATECGEHIGYHISVENGIIESIKNNQRVSAGEIGEIFITDFDNYAMPFIRYQVGDLGTPFEEKCNCGRGLPMLKSIDGRTTDLIVTPSGRFISGPGLTLIIKDLRNIKQCQFIQDRREKLVVKIIKTPNYSEKDRHNILTALHRYIGKDIDIKLKFVDSITTGPSGKQRFVISKVPIRF